MFYQSYYCFLELDRWRFCDADCDRVTQVSSRHTENGQEGIASSPRSRMQVFEYNGRIELIPERDIKELRGFLKGINTEFEREEDRV